uniref:Uncharacterized protein n=1 Tax=Daphnia galeata TaxID=27404 RepID=A0A8J2RTX3_9CRUS|nr:unnamed protein product [Daphnia galeata]
MDKQLVLDEGIRENHDGGSDEDKKGSEKWIKEKNGTQNDEENENTNKIRNKIIIDIKINLQINFKENDGFQDRKPRQNFSQNSMTGLPMPSQNSVPGLPMPCISSVAQQGGPSGQSSVPGFPTPDNLSVPRQGGSGFLQSDFSNQSIASFLKKNGGFFSLDHFKDLLNSDHINFAERESVIIAEFQAAGRRPPAIQVPEFGFSLSLKTVEQLNAHMQVDSVTLGNLREKFLVTKEIVNRQYPHISRQVMSCCSLFHLPN